MPRGLVQVKAIKPRKKNVRKYLAEIRKELENQGKITERMFKKTTRTWVHKPKFKTKFAIGKPPAAKTRLGRVLPGKRAAYVVVYTTDKRYLWIDEGTKRRTITPRKPGGRLVFREKFVPKTKPGIIGSTAGKIGGDLIVAKRVSHPGTKARGFTKEIGKRRRRHFYAAMRKANSKALRAAGYKG